MLGTRDKNIIEKSNLVLELFYSKCYNTQEVCEKCMKTFAVHWCRLHARYDQCERI